jgi:hypothetical protein
MPAGATLSGKFTVTNKTNPSDTATDTDDRDIKINTTWLPMAQAELAKINFTSVLINIPLEENEKAKEAAIAEVKLAMEGKVSGGYTVDFAATGYENRILSGTFTITSKGYPLLDTASESRDITVDTSWLPLAQAELAKINVTSVLINIPLEENEKAKEAAIAEVKLVMEGKVSAGYTIDFVATGYENKILSGTFTITSKGYPLLDTAAESRDITVETSWLPTAQRELDKIDVPAVSILVSMLHNDSRDQAVNQAVSQAQAQVPEGYSVDFEWTDYSVKGTVSGKFTVTNDAYPFDTATGDEKIIIVSYTPNALGELGKIRVSQVPVSVPTDVAQEQASTRAAEIAQKQVSPGYNVTYKSDFYFSPPLNNTSAAMEGKFTVTSATDPGDKAEDSAVRKMNALFTNAELETKKIIVPFASHFTSIRPSHERSVCAFHLKLQAQQQVSLGYTVYVTKAGGVSPGPLECSFIVINDNYPEDQYKGHISCPMLLLLDPPAAQNEIIKINVNDLTLDVPISRESALAAALKIARAQVAPGYTVSGRVYVDALLDPGLNFFVPSFDVLNNAIPTDTTLRNHHNIYVIYAHPTAAGELAKISVPSVTVTVTPGHVSAKTAAVARAELAARAQIQPEYTMAFVPTSYSDGILSGKFTVSNAGDSAEDDVERMVAVNYALSNAADELAKINMPIMSITAPLDNGGAADEAVAAVMLVVQKQVTPGYAVTFSREGNAVAGGVLSGRFSVTNGSDPSDTAEDATNRTIEIRYTTASEVLSEIDMPSVTIDIPVELPFVSMDAFASRVVELAQAQVRPGYTVIFEIVNYYEYGEGVGRFTVTNDNNPADTASDGSDRIISVKSTYIRNAVDELARINIPGVNVSMLLDDSGALDAAVSAAEAGAQLIRMPGFTAKFTPTGEIADDGTLTGRFTVTNNDFPIDTATYKTDWTITVSSTV